MFLTKRTLIATLAAVTFFVLTLNGGYETSSLKASSVSFLTQNSGWNLVETNPIYPSRLGELSCYAQNCVLVGYSANQMPELFYSINDGQLFKASIIPTGIISISHVTCITVNVCYAVAKLQNGVSGILYSINSYSVFSFMPIAKSLDVASLNCFSPTNCLIAGTLLGNGVLYYTNGKFLSRMFYGNQLNMISYANCFSNVCLAFGQSQISNSGLEVFISKNGPLNFINYLNIPQVNTVLSIQCLPTVCYVLTNSYLGTQALYYFDLSSFKLFSVLLAGYFEIQTIKCFAISGCFIGGLNQLTAVPFIGSLNLTSVNLAQLPEITGEIVNLACSNYGFCMAIGLNPGTGLDFLLASENKASWVLTNSALNYSAVGLGCLNNNTCIVSGYLDNQLSEPLIYSYSINANTQSVIDVPNALGEINSIGCLNNTCFVVGQSYGGRPLIQQILLPDFSESQLNFSQLDYEGDVASISCSNSYCLIGVDTYYDGNLVVNVYKIQQVTSGDVTINAVPVLTERPGQLVGLTCYFFNCVVAINYNGHYSVFYSVNCAQNFLESELPADLNEINSVICQSQLCVLSGNNVFFQAAVFVSTNYGAIFKDASYSNTSPSDLESINCFNAFCIGGGFSQNNVGNSGVLMISNGNFTFSQNNSLSALSLINSIDCANENLCFATGFSSNQDGFVLYQSNNQGLNWQAVSLPLFNYAYLTQCFNNGCFLIGQNASGISIYTTFKVFPQVTSLYPNSGSTSGGGNVVIYGSGFSSVESVSFGSNSAEFNVVTPNEIVARVPKASAGIVPVVIRNYYGTSQINLSSQYLYVAPGKYNALRNPIRVCDTRPGANDPATYASKTLGSYQVISVGFSQYVPAGTSSVVINVTAVNPSSSGYLSIWPAGLAEPTGSSLTYNSSIFAKSSLITVPLGQNDEINIFNSKGTTDVLIDLIGYYGSLGLRYNPLIPFRVVDTRSYSNNTFQDSGANLTSDSTVTINLSGIIPSGALAVELNVTAIDPSKSGDYLSLYPFLSTRPSISNLNPSVGFIESNQVIVPLNNSYKIAIYNFVGSVDLLVDVLGVFTNSGLSFQSISVTRVVDTRSYEQNEFLYAFAKPYENVVNYLNLNELNLLPNTIYGLFGTITILNVTGPGYATVGSSNLALPDTSVINWQDGQTSSSSFSIEVYNGAIGLKPVGSKADVIIDLFGYYVQ